MYREESMSCIGMPSSKCDQQMTCRSCIFMHLWKLWEGHGKGAYTPPKTQANEICKIIDSKTPSNLPNQGTKNMGNWIFCRSYAFLCLFYLFPYIRNTNPPPLYHVISDHSSPSPALYTPTCTMSNLVASPMGTAPDKPSAKSGAAQTKPRRAKASHKCNMSSAGFERVLSCLVSMCMLFWK